MIPDKKYTYEYVFELFYKYLHDYQTPKDEESKQVAKRLNKYTGPSFSETLHEDLVFLILSYCEIETMVCASNTNKFWRQIMK